MGFYKDHILPRIVDRVLSGREPQKLRQRCLAGLSGTVLEVGFGSGHNLPFYPTEVTRILACDPSRLGRKLAQKRLTEATVPVDFVGLEGEAIGLEDGSVDYVVTTWTLCTIPDVQKALHEIRRLLRPGGRLHFMEHGRARDDSVAKWQDRLNPLQKLIGGGCHLNRRIDDLIEQGGLDMRLLENFYMTGPRVGSFMYSGIAVRTAPPEALRYNVLR